MGYKILQKCTIKRGATLSRYLVYAVKQELISHPADHYISIAAISLGLASGNFFFSV